ncbi:MAG: sporulation sigma factor SigE [Clostridiales bacterium 41_21_two_genomes]|nr:MAG: sporulation sigma factor SigE [Clostridiales bacterium 41_21_two_genomes]
MRRFILFTEIINAIIIKLFNSNFCHYINGPETLPPPLTKEEEERVLQAITDGDESARDELITHNLRLVVYIAKKFDSPSASTEDLVSIGTIGLMKAVKTFAPEKNIKLATYASRCIENEILMYLRKTSNSKTEMSFDEPLSVDWDGNELTLRDVLGSEPDEICQSVEYDDEKRLLRSVVSRLTPKERNIMELRFGLNNNPIYTQKQLADKMGISQSYISRLEKRILKKIRDEMQRQVACL